MGLIVKPERTVMTADLAQLKQIITNFLNLPKQIMLVKVWCLETPRLTWYMLGQSKL